MGAKSKEEMGAEPVKFQTWVETKRIEFDGLPENMWELLLTKSKIQAIKRKE